MTSMARITSPGWSPGAIKTDRAPDQLPAEQELDHRRRRPMVISATRNLAKIWKPLIIFPE